MTTNYFKVTNKETGKWEVGTSPEGVAKTIWELLSNEDDSEFLQFFREDPSSFYWEILEEGTFKKLLKSSEKDEMSYSFKEPKKKRSGKTPVRLISKFSITDHNSISEVVNLLKGTVSKGKIMKMVDDPSVSFEGYRIEKL